jgi:multidrug resistance efflux pump
MVAVELMLEKLDVPADSKATLEPADPRQTPPGTASPPTQHGKLATAPTGSATQLDLVNLGTAIIDARGTLRLAQARHDRLKKLGDSKTASQEEVDIAAINRETAQQKLELLTNIATAAFQAARAETAAAEAAMQHADRLRQKGFVSQSEVDRAAAQIETARAKLKLLESIVTASTPNTSPPKTSDESRTEPPPLPKR